MSLGRQSLARTLTRLGLTRSQANVAVHSVLGKIHEALGARERVAIHGFGSFVFRNNLRTRMWDPRTRTSRPVRGGALLRFKPASDFLRLLRSR